MAASRLLCVAATALTLCACADLSVYRISDTPNGDDPPPATQSLRGDVSYYLPRTVITLTGAVTLTDCKNGPVPKLSVSGQFTPVISTEPDPDYHYAVSYEKSRSWMKQVNFTVTSQSGYLATFNSTINDQLGPDIVAGLGTLVQIGGAVAVGAVGAPAVTAALSEPEHGRAPASVTPTPDYCAAVGKPLATIADISRRIDWIQRHPAPTADGRALQALEVQSLQANTTTLQKGLTRSVMFRWVPTFADLKNGTPVSHYTVLSKWVDISSVAGEWLGPVASGLKWAGAGTGSSLTEFALLTLAVDNNTLVEKPDASGDLSSDGSSTLNNPGGLLIRNPAIGLFRICRPQGPTDTDCGTDNAPTLSNALMDTTDDLGGRMRVVLPQLGKFIVLPEHNAMFDNDTLAVTLNTDGTISSLGYQSSNTASTQIAAVGTAASNAQTAIAARDTAIAGLSSGNAAVTTATTAQVQAPDTYNSALADCLTKSASIVAAGGKPVPCQ